MKYVHKLVNKNAFENSNACIIIGVLSQTFFLGILIGLNLCSKWPKVSFNLLLLIYDQLSIWIGKLVGYAYVYRRNSSR